MQNFAFVASNVYRERIAGEIRCAAFGRRVREVLGENTPFRSLMAGVMAINEDYWDSGRDEIGKLLSGLPRPFGVFANNDFEATSVMAACRRTGLSVPSDAEILGVNDACGLCEQMRPALSSIFPDYAQCAEKAVDMLLSMAASPGQAGVRSVKVSDANLVERGSTAMGRDYGHIASRAREFIRLNACNGIKVPDVARHLGISRRTLEKRVLETTGGSVLAMIHKVRLDNVRHLLAKTSLSISEITMRSGCELTSNLGKMFRKKFGFSLCW